jgi:hypothetical protein
LCSPCCQFLLMVHYWLLLSGFSRVYLSIDWISKSHIFVHVPGFPTSYGICCVQWVDVKGGCWFFLISVNCWPSHFILSFHRFCNKIHQKAEKNPNNLDLWKESIKCDGQQFTDIKKNQQPNVAIYY